MARFKRKHHHQADEPILHADHPRPVTRRDFLSAGLISGGAFVMAPTLMNLLSSNAMAATLADCGLGGVLKGRIPFIAFDLSGGANMVGSHVMVGGQGGPFDFFSNAGYRKMGLPDDQIPNSDTDPRINVEFGLPIHADSAYLRGMLSKTSIGARALVNGAIIPARSDNDTSNNPHNPMYGIAKAADPDLNPQGGGKFGELLQLIGTRNSDSGGSSEAPTNMIDLSVRPTKVDRPSDATGLVDTGDLGQMMPSTAEAGAVMEAIEKLSFNKIDAATNPDRIADDPNVKLSLQDQVHCGYIKTTDTVTNFGDISAFDPLSDENIVPVGTKTAPLVQSNADIGAVTPLDPTQSIFSNTELDPGNANNSSMFGKTAAVMKMVCNGLAGAGTIQQGGYDYHDGSRATGEIRDFRAGQCMGACIEYAHRVGKPLFIYVFSDGSLASNGQLDNSANGRGKGEWTGDNSSTAASYFLVYNPLGQPVLKSTAGQDQLQHQQLGYFRDSGSVETSGTTPGANNPNLLAEMAILNYMALHTEVGIFQNIFNGAQGSPGSLGTLSGAELDKLIAFEPIMNTGA